MATAEGTPVNKRKTGEIYLTVVKCDTGIFRLRTQQTRVSYLVLGSMKHEQLLRNSIEEKGII
jgi:hypothetical protein